MKHVMIALVAVLVLAGCASSTDSGAPADDPAPDTDADPAPGTEADPGTGTGSTVPADGGLSVEEAKASDLDSPLLVTGYIVADNEVVRLCDLLMESFPPQCGGESLLVEGLDLDGYETSSESGVRWTEAPTSILGEVDGETLHVNDAAA